MSIIKAELSAYSDVAMSVVGRPTRGTTYLKGEISCISSCKDTLATKFDKLININRLTS